MSLLLFPLNGIMFLIALAIRVLVIVALIDALLKPERAYVAAGKQTKLIWIAILVVGLLITIVGVIGAIVYFVDVRPALRGMGGGRGRGGGRGGSSSDGPYGPYNGR